MYTIIGFFAALATTAAAKTVVITAGSGGFVFSPESVTADVGDTLEFHFVGSIHTAVQGDFSTPCSMGSLASTGFDSGPVTSVCSPPGFVFSSRTSQCLTNLPAVRGLPSDCGKHRPNMVLLRNTNPLPRRHGRRSQPPFIRKFTCILQVSRSRHLLIQLSR